MHAVQLVGGTGEGGPFGQFGRRKLADLTAVSHLKDTKESQWVRHEAFGTEEVWPISPSSSVVFSNY